MLLHRLVRLHHNSWKLLYCTMTDIDVVQLASSVQTDAFCHKAPFIATFAGLYIVTRACPTLIVVVRWNSADLPQP